MENVQQHGSAVEPVRIRDRFGIRHVRRHPAWTLTVLFLLSCVLITPYLRGDGLGYYAWLASPMTDADLDFTDEYQQGDPSFLLNIFESDRMTFLEGRIIEATGLPVNQWSTGAAILWIPFYGAGTAAAAILDSPGEPGFTAPQRWFVGVGSAAMAFGSLLIAFHLSRKRLGIAASLIGVIGIWLGSSLPIYQYFLSFYPFAVGAFAGAVLLWVWVRRQGWGWQRWAVLGLLSGFLISIHPIAITWSVLPLAGLVWLDPGTREQRLRALLPFVAGGVVGYLPQMVLKWIVYANPFDTGYDSAWNFLTPPIVRELLSANHGLISWTPITLVSLAGLAVVVRRDRRLGLGLIVVFVALLYMAAAYTSDEASSFGNRFFVVFTAGFAIGLAAAMSWIWERRSHVWRWVATAGVGILIVWNILFMFQWGWGLVPKRGPVDWSTMVAQQFTTAPAEMGHAIELLLTDRAELLRIVQENDLINIDKGDL